MASPQHLTTIENLPRDVLSDIFVRLLAKEVAQMRCVSNSWNALLSHPSFIKSHLHHSIQNNDEILLFFDTVFSFGFGPSPFTARPSCSPDLELANFIKPPVIPPCKYGCGFVIGSVSGLICFYDHGIHIWNPSLSALLTLPPSPFPLRVSVESYFRFGFNPETNDYKVVRLTRRLQPCNILFQVEAYSMRKGSWELMSQSFPSYITTISRQDEVCVDGHDGQLHWLCATDLNWKPQTILAFDLDVDRFHEILLPDSILDSNLSRFNVLGVLCGKLCVMSRVVRDGGEWEVWVMDEYEVAESWVKHHVFSQFSGNIKLYGFTSKNEFLFQDDDCFALYDPITGKTKTFKITGGVGISKIVEYVDSLVWVTPEKHELSKGHLLVSILNIHRLLKGVQMAIIGISRLLFRRGIN